MTKYKPITQEQLIKGILKQLPEINPEYVRNTLTEQKLSHFVVSDIAKYARQFEIDLYSEGV